MFDKIVGLASLVIAIIGVPLTFILARRSRKRPELHYLEDFDVLLDSSDRLFDEGLYMTLGDEKIESISRMRIALWNDQGDTIRGSDIVEGDPFRFEFPSGSTPLQARIIATSRRQNNLSVTVVSKDKLSVGIDFDFLDANDGGIIEVINQGTIKPNITGTVRGATIKSKGSGSLRLEDLKRIRESSPARGLAKLVKRPLVIVYSLLCVGVIAVVVSVVVPFFRPSGSLVNPRLYNLGTINGQLDFIDAVMKTNYYNQQGELPFLSIIATIAFVAACILGYLWQKSRKNRIPKSIVLDNLSST